MDPKNMKGITYLCGVLLMTLAFPLFGEDAVKIHGIVRDLGDVPLSGAAVSLKRNSDAAETVVYTDARGEFIFQDCKKGEYWLRVERDGFQAVTAPIRLEEETLRKIEINLRPLQHYHVEVQSRLPRVLIICTFQVVHAPITATTAKNWTTIEIKNFGRIDEQYFRGAQPQGHDYEDLSGLGIKTVITLTSTDTDPNEKVMVEKAGMKYCEIPMDSHTPPADSQVAEFLRLVNDPVNRPVYVHCVAGKHRTGVMTAIYRMSKHRWTADQAYKEMQKYQFGPALFHLKLKRFVYDYYRRLIHASGVFEPPCVSSECQVHQ